MPFTRDLRIVDEPSHHTKQRQAPSTLVLMPAPTSDPVEITRAAHQLLPRLEDGVRWARAGTELAVVTD